ncbi:cupin domain-containing protein [Chloroflexota bacterium]
MIIVDVKDCPIIESKHPLVDKTAGKLHKQVLIMPEDTGGQGVVMTKFTMGGKLSFHTHSGEQILFFTKGKGMVATRDKEYIVTTGTTVYIPAGEIHSHGAAPGCNCTHFTVFRGDSKAA